MTRSPNRNTEQAQQIQEFNQDISEVRGGGATSTNPVTSKTALSKVGTTTINQGEASSNLLLGSRLQSLDMDNGERQNSFMDRFETRAYKTYSPCDILFQDGPQKHLMSPISFELQQSRPLFADERKPPNEKRFSYYHHYPTMLTQFSKVAPPIFKKSMKRAELFPTKVKNVMPMYDIDKDKVMPVLSVGVPSFEKQTDRPSVVKKARIPQTYDTQKLREAFKGQGHVRRERAVGIAKQLPRDNKLYNLTETYNLNEDSSFIKRFNLLSKIKDSATMAKLERFISKRFSTPLRAYSTCRDTPTPSTPHPRRTPMSTSMRVSKNVITPHMKASSVIPGIEFESSVRERTPERDRSEELRFVNIQIES